MGNSHYISFFCSAPAEADSEAPVQIDKGQKHRHSHSDPGHILARFNCVAAQSEGPGDPSRRKRYDLAIDASFGPDIFHRTKVRVNAEILQTGTTLIKEQCKQLRIY